MNDFFDDDDGFFNQRRGNKQALINRLGRSTQDPFGQPIEPKEIILREGQDLFPGSLDDNPLFNDPSRKIRLLQFEVLKPDGMGGYYRARAETYNPDSGCGCILCMSNPAIHVCQYCDRETCGNPSCSSRCCKCGIRVCRGCLSIFEKRVYCPSHSPGLLRRIFS